MRGVEGARVVTAPRSATPRHLFRFRLRKQDGLRQGPREAVAVGCLVFIHSHLLDLDVPVTPDPTRIRRGHGLWVERSEYAASRRGAAMRPVQNLPNRSKAIQKQGRLAYPETLMIGRNRVSANSLKNRARS